MAVAGFGVSDVKCRFAIIKAAAVVNYTRPAVMHYTESLTVLLQ